MILNLVIKNSLKEGANRMEWLGLIGSMFNKYTSPVDSVMAWGVQIAVEGLSWVLSQIVAIMTLSNEFYNVQITKDIFYIINFFSGMLAVSVGTYFVFSQLLSVAVGNDAKPPMQIIGAFINYGFRILSMPFFLFTALELNSAFINGVIKLGLSSKKIEDDLHLNNEDPTAFIQRMGSLYKVSEDSILMGALLSIMLLIVFLTLFFQMMKRTGEIFFIYIFIPPVALSCLTNDLDMYSSWWRQTLSVIGGQSVQVLGIYAGFQFLIESHGLMATGILLATITTPVVVKEFAYNSGIGGFFKQAGSVAMMGAVK